MLATVWSWSAQSQVANPRALRRPGGRAAVRREGLQASVLPFQAPGESPTPRRHRGPLPAPIASQQAPDPRRRMIPDQSNRGPRCGSISWESSGLATRCPGCGDSLVRPGYSDHLSSSGGDRGTGGEFLRSVSYSPYLFSATMPPAQAPSGYRETPRLPANSTYSTLRATSRHSHCCRGFPDQSLL